MESELQNGKLARDGEDKIASNREFVLSNCPVYIYCMAHGFDTVL